VVRPETRDPWPSRFERYVLRETRFEPVVQGLTDGRGRLVLDLPAGDRWLLRIGLNGHGPRCLLWKTSRVPLGVRLEPGETRTFRVVGPDGAPLVGAEILVYADDPHGEPALARVLTDVAGRATAPLAPLDSLLVRAPGFASRLISDALGRKSDTIVLEAEVRLEGIVQDERGEPIPGACVTVIRDLYEQTVTDEEGRFRFVGLSPGGGVLDLVAEKPGHAPGKMETPPGRNDIEIVLARERALVGRVLLPDGTPATGARVWWLRPHESLQTDRRVDASDGFRLQPVPPGPIVLEASLRRRFEALPSAGPVITHRARLVARVPKEGSHVPVTLRLREESLSFLKIRVVDPDSEPVREAWIATRAPVATRERPRTDATGCATLVLSLPAGSTVGLSVAPPSERSGLHITQAYLPTAAGPDLPPRVVILPGREPVTVRIRDHAGKPLPPDAPPTIRDLHGNLLRRSGPDTYLAEEGAWVDVGAPGYARFRVHIDAETVVDGVAEIRVPRAATIRGRLEPEALIVDSIDASTDGWFLSMRPEPEDRGRFELIGVPSGRVLLSIDAEGEEFPLRVVHVKPGETIDLGVLRPDQRPTVRGRVLLPDGEPAGGATVTLLDGEEELAEMATASDGSFSMRAPFFEGGRLVARRDGLAPASAPLQADTEGRPVVLRLRETGRMLVRLEPAPDLRAKIGWEIGDGWCHETETILDEETGAQAHLLRDLPPGDHVLRVHTHDLGGRSLRGEARVRVASGTTRQATVRLHLAR
jgi:hypothetical protein